MKLLPSSNAPLHEPDAAPAPASPRDLERLDTLEKVATAILQRLQALEEKMDALEAAPPASAPVANAPASPEPAPMPPAATAPDLADIRIDSEALKKGLLTKMWTYLNEEGCR